MIQIKEFVDSDTSLAEQIANEFLASLKEEQVVDIRYASFVKKHAASSMGQQRSAILVIYKTGDGDKMISR